MTKQKWVMATMEFGSPVFIAPLSADGAIRITDKIEEAELWTEKDHSPVKLDYHKSVTGYQQLAWLSPEIFSHIGLQASDSVATFHDRIQRIRKLAEKNPQRTYLQGITEFADRLLAIEGDQERIEKIIETMNALLHEEFKRRFGSEWKGDFSKTKH